VSEMTAKVTVRRGDAFRALLDRIMAKRYGCLMLWLNDGVVVKVADIEPELISELDQRVKLVDQAPVPRKRSTRKTAKSSNGQKKSSD